VTDRIRVGKLSLLVLSTPTGFSSPDPGAEIKVYIELSRFFGLGSA
jgi:hypothetical protein